MSNEESPKNVVSIDSWRAKKQKSQGEPDRPAAASPAKNILAKVVKMPGPSEEELQSERDYRDLVETSPLLEMAEDLGQLGTAGFEHKFGEVGEKMRLIRSIVEGQYSTYAYRQALEELATKRKQELEDIILKSDKNMIKTHPGYYAAVMYLYSRSVLQK